MIGPYEWVKLLEPPASGLVQSIALLQDCHDDLDAARGFCKKQCAPHR